MFNEIERLLADRKGMVEDIKTLKAQNEEMRELLKTIYETDCLPWFAFDKGDEEESIADKVIRFARL